MLPIVIGFHGTDVATAEKVLLDPEAFRESDGLDEWLGHGTYFWIGSLRRARDWARRRHDRPAVIGAVIETRNCLDLTDLESTRQLSEAYAALAAAFTSLGLAIPENDRSIDGVFVDRKLDCAVFQFMHLIREFSGRPKFDTVVGAFEDGPFSFPNGTIRDKSHIQIAVKNKKCFQQLFFAE